MRSSSLHGRSSEAAIFAMTNPQPARRKSIQPINSKWQPRPHQHDTSIKTHDFAYLSGIPDPTALSQFLTWLTPLIAQPLLLQTLTLIFGGCCSNVYALESILNLSSDTGTLITFLQFTAIALYTLPSQLTFRVTATEKKPLQPTKTVWLPRLRERKAPLRKWIMFASQFVMINTLNNAAFGYKISLPLHIILRSAGPVASMAVGRVWAGRRYSWQKVAAVGMLFAGVVLAALSDAGAKPGEKVDKGSEDDAANVLTEQAPGFALLTLALLLSAVMGVWSDGIYSRYGRSTAIANEQVFYGHLLSLPFFALQVGTLRSQWTQLMAASEVAFPRARVSPLSKGETPMAKFLYAAAAANELAKQRQLGWQQRWFSVGMFDNAPKAIVYLLLNCITQIACISGVHRLSTQTSALTVSIVLNVRKVVSLLLSIYIFGNELAAGVLIGAVVVFGGGLLYGMPERKKEESKEKEKGTDGETKKNR